MISASDGLRRALVGFEEWGKYGGDDGGPPIGAGAGLQLLRGCFGEVFQPFDHGVEGGDDFFCLGVMADEFDGRGASVGGCSGYTMEEQWSTEVAFAVGEGRYLANEAIPP